MASPFITSPERNVYVMNNANAESRYRARNLKAFELDEIAISVSAIDALIEARLLEHLEQDIVYEETDAVLNELATLNGQPIDTIPGVSLVDSFRAVDTQEQTPVTTPDSRIEEIERNIARLDREYNVTFDIMSDTDIRENRASKARLIKRLDDVKKSQEHTVQEQRDSQELIDLVASGTLQEHWRKWKIEKKQKCIRLATQDIVLDRVTDTWITLTIKWNSWLSKDDARKGVLYVDTGYILRSTSGYITWSDEEDRLVRELYPMASRNEILHALPRRSWWSIRVHASNLRVVRQTRINGSELPYDMSVDDIDFMQKHGLMLDGSDKRVWWKSEVCQLDVTSLPGSVPVIPRRYRDTARV